MIAILMLYGILVGGFLFAACSLLERALGSFGLPLRWVWAGGLVVLVLLVGLAPGRATPFETLPPPVHPEAIYDHTIGAPVPELMGLAPPPAPRAMEIGRRAAAIERISELAVAAGVSRLDRHLSAVWAILSGGLLALILWTVAHARRVRGRYPQTDVLGAPVRISDGAGPAVLGVLRPEVVVPGWLLDGPEDERRLAIEHERQHVAAGDPLLLLSGWVAVALVPWNPFAWWLLSRLRLAVELDCDARVLGRGRSARRYASLLLRVAGREGATLAGATALGGRRSHLERRIRAIAPAERRWPIVSGAVLVLPAVALALVACDLTLPTPIATEPAPVSIDATPVGSGPAAGPAVSEGDPSDPDATADERGVTAGDSDEAPIDSTGALLDAGVVPSEDDSSSADLEELATAYPEVDHPDAQAPAEGLQGDPRAATPSGPWQWEIPTGARVRLASGEPSFYVVDGVIVRPENFRVVDPELIESVEVIRGEAAARLYGSRAANNGVIRIVTRAGGEAREVGMVIGPRLSTADGTPIGAVRVVRERNESGAARIEMVPDR